MGSGSIKRNRACGWHITLHGDSCRAIGMTAVGCWRSGCGQETSALLPPTWSPGAICICFQSLQQQRTDPCMSTLCLNPPGSSERDISPLLILPPDSVTSPLPAARLSLAFPPQPAPRATRPPYSHPLPRRSPGLTVPKNLFGWTCHTPIQGTSIVYSHSFTCSFLIVHSFKPQTFAEWPPCTRHHAKCPHTKHTPHAGSMRA